MILRLLRSVSIAFLGTALIALSACSKTTAGTGNGDSYVGGNGTLSKSDVSARLTTAAQEANTSLTLISQGKLTASLFLPANGGCISILFSCTVLDGLTGTNATLPGDLLEQNAANLLTILSKLTVQLVDGYPTGNTYTQDPKMVTDLSTNTPDATSFVVLAYYPNVNDANNDTAYSDAGLIIHEMLHIWLQLKDQDTIQGNLVQDEFTLAGVLDADFAGQFDHMPTAVSGSGSGSGSGSTGGALPLPPAIPPLLPAP